MILSKQTFKVNLVADMWPVGFAYDGTYGIILPLVAAMTGIFITFNLAKYIIGDSEVPIKDLTKHHNWKSAKILAKVCQ